MSQNCQNKAGKMEDGKTGQGQGQKAEVTHHAHERRLRQRGSRSWREHRWVAELSYKKRQNSEEQVAKRKHELRPAGGI